MVLDLELVPQIHHPFALFSKPIKNFGNFFKRQNRVTLKISMRIFLNVNKKLIEFLKPRNILQFNPGMSETSSLFVHNLKGT